MTGSGTRAFRDGIRGIVAMIATGAIIAISAPVAAAATAVPTASSTESIAGAVAPRTATGEACRPGNVVLTPQTPSALVTLGAEELATHATGKGVTVAVVDSGIDVGNPHLTGAVIGGIDLVGDGERPDGLSDPHGHGTIIAGEIAARRVPGSGVVGLAPDAALLSVRVFRSDSDEDRDKGFGPTPERIAAGIRWAVDNGADVINVSMSMQQDAPVLRDAVEYADARGALVVASAGNRASVPEGTADGVRFPAGYPQALGVTAGGLDGRATDDSMHGPQVDIAAPGVNVLSTATGAGDCQFSDEAPSASFATGYASAAAALVAQAHPAESPAEWAYRLTATAIRSDADRRDDIDGWGFIQPLAAIDLLPDASTRGPASPFFDTSDSAVRPRGVEIESTATVTPFALTSETALIVGVVSAALLGLLASLLLLRRSTRRLPATDGGATDTPAPSSSRGGLLDRAPTSPF